MSVRTHESPISNSTLPSITICGIRGIPACYGGFETFAEELSTRLVALGYDVTVYGRTHVIEYPEPLYRGVRIRLLPAPKHKYLETPVHSLRCFLDLLRHPPDVLLVCNAANSPFVWLPRLRGIPVAVNVDGVERKRAKWNWLGRAWYLLGELCSVAFASEIVADAKVIRDYYLSTYRCRSTVIGYGYRANHEEAVDAKVRSGADSYESDLFTSLKIRPNAYILYVSRLEPENHAHTVIAAYNRLPEQVRAAFPLVVVGDAPYARDYVEGLHRLAGEGVIFTGYRFGADYEVLQLGAAVYVQATEVGGTHPALVEAMGFGNCIVANDTPEHREVLAEAGIYYAKNSELELTGQLTELLARPEQRATLRQAARTRALREYSWAKITHDYESLLLRLAGRNDLLPRSSIG